MFGLIIVSLFATVVHPLTHHLAVGTIDGQALYSLETDDVARRVYMIQARDAAGASSSLALDVCAHVLFGLTSDGFTTLRSKEIVGDVHSLAWSPTGRNLHALNSRSSASSTTSITNFRIAEDPNLEDIAGTDILANVTSASQIVSHPTSDLVYLVTKDTNELVTLPLQQMNMRLRHRATASPSRYRLLPSSLDATQFHTSSLAITSSKNTLWTLSQSQNQAVITAFSLNATTGEVLNVAARASWQGAGEGQLTAAPFAAGEVVAITNSPMGYITVLGLEQNLAGFASEFGQSSEHDYLKAMPVTGLKRDGMDAAAARIQSYGRAILDDFIGLGESVWID
ncbi:hypothetical protein N0V83_003182 [Neocucurbitaria cava]|uniref:Uncharacterized protein n=1 Tax=Neocucurbitaria cava TaxID=798079 RepID=A0A9W8YCQ5_9PLEO|nr:hypothetical protein N0V83_003182 [Neocucurbitaria cava]